jgi:hypothetical protein
MYFHVDYPDLNRLENQASSMITGIMAQDFFIVKNDKTTIVDKINTSINDNQSIIPINFRV